MGSTRLRSGYGDCGCRPRTVLAFTLSFSLAFPTWFLLEVDILCRSSFRALSQMALECENLHSFADFGQPFGVNVWNQQAAFSLVGAFGLALAFALGCPLEPPFAPAAEAASSALFFFLSSLLLSGRRGLSPNRLQTNGS